MSNYKYIAGGVVNPLISKFITGGPIKTFDINNSVSPTQYWDEYVAENSVPFTVVPEAPIDEKELAKRQAWAESAGNDRARSPKGAKGRYQIMPAILKEYQLKTKDIGNIYDPKYNRKVRDWEFNRYKNSETVNMGNPTDSVKMGRRLAAYNYGLSNVNKTLTRLNKQGINTTTNFDWLDYFPKETRNYVNFVLRGKDTGAHRTNEAYENRKNK